MNSQAHSLVAAGVVFLAGVVVFWTILVPFALGTVEKLLGLHRPKPERKP